MFEDWKQAWREAVENFRRELEEDDAGGDARVRGMNREYQAANAALDRLDAEIRRAQRDAGEERESEQVCRRREEMARRIGDEETARIAAEYGRRHAERAIVLQRKVEVFMEERALLGRDLEGMKRVLGEQADAAQVGGVRSESIRDIIEERRKQDRDFGRLEREAKEKAAEERLEELKKRMR